MPFSQRIMIGWTVAGLLFWAIYSFFQPQDRHFTLIYYYVWILGMGSFLWLYRQRIRTAVQNRQGSAFVRFLLLGLLMVGIEEIFAAFFNHLDEGFRFVTLLQRIGQFEIMNLWVFTGLLTGAYGAIKKMRFSEKEIFYLFGTVGLFTERVIWQAPAHPVAFLAIAPLIIMTYGIIIVPAAMSLALEGSSQKPRPVHYASFILFTLIAGSVFVFLLGSLANHYPWLIAPQFRNP